MPKYKKPRKKVSMSAKIIIGTQKYTFNDDPIDKVIDFLKEIDKYK